MPDLKRTLGKSFVLFTTFDLFFNSCEDELFVGGDFQF